MVEGFVCPYDPWSCVIRDEKPLVGTPKWSQGRGQMSNSEDSDGRNIKVLENLIRDRKTRTILELPWGLVRQS